MRTNPRDKSKPKKAYAVAQTQGKLSLEGLAEHMTTHGCVYKRGDIYSVLSQAVDCIVEMLLSGYLIQLGEMGTFRLTLSSVGAESASLFSAANITKVNVCWSPGDRFQNLREEAEFELVTDLMTKAAVIKATKEGTDVYTAVGGQRTNVTPSTGESSGGTTGV